jgi:hypothetical protein
MLRFHYCISHDEIIGNIFTVDNCYIVINYLLDYIVVSCLVTVSYLTDYCASFKDARVHSTIFCGHVIVIVNTRNIHSLAQHHIAMTKMYKIAYQLCIIILATTL